MRVKEKKTIVLFQGSFCAISRKRIGFFVLFQGRKNPEYLVAQKLTAC